MGENWRFGFLQMFVVGGRAVDTDGAIGLEVRTRMEECVVLLKVVEAIIGLLLKTAVDDGVFDLVVNFDRPDCVGLNDR